MKKICAIFNICPLYRKAIFKAMSEELNVDFYFGDINYENIHLLNPNSISGFKKFLHNVYKGSKLVWQKGALKAAFSGLKYHYYLLTGNAGIKSNWIIMILARLLGKQPWLWTHGLRGNESKMSRFVNLLYMKLASGLLFYNERGAELAIKNGVSAKKIHVIYNSLDYENQKVLRGKTGDSSFVRNYFGNDNPYVLFMGRLTASKKINIMIEAIRIVDCNIIIVGDGPERDKLESLVRELNLEDKVWFYGECYDEQMNAQFIYNSALLISPGNVGLSAIHAMTYGTAVVTHNEFNLQMPEFEAVKELSSMLGIELFFANDNEVSLAEVTRNVLLYVMANRESVRKACYSIIENKWNASNQIEIMKSIFGI